MYEPRPRILTVHDAVRWFSDDEALHDWGRAMGSDFHRAWRECQHGVWLLFLASGLGATNEEMLDVFERFTGERGDFNARRVEEFLPGLAEACDSPDVDRRLLDALRSTLDLDRLLARARNAADWN